MAARAGQRLSRRRFERTSRKGMAVPLRRVELYRRREQKERVVNVAST